jgi:hypothetical protein
MDEALAAFNAATPAIRKTGTGLDVAAFGDFYSSGPCQGAAGPPVVRVLMHYPADLEHRLAGAMILLGGLF